MTEKTKVSIITQAVNKALEDGTSIEDAIKHSISYIEGEEEREKDEI